jgi:uncharacterized RDD family membrane protein YckC
MTDLNDTFKIDTPENVSFDYNVAGVGSRFLAALVDTILILLLQVIIIGTALAVLRVSTSEALAESPLFSWFIAIAGLVSFVFFWGYYVFFEILWNGQSPGKRWVGLRVIRMDGTPIGASEAVIRNLVRIIDLLPSAYGVGVVVMFLNSNSRRVGDLAAGTIVVHERSTQDLSEISPVRISTLENTAQSDLPADFPIKKLTERDLHIIEEFLSRRRDLANRSTLAAHILMSIAKNLEVPYETFMGRSAESALTALYKAATKDRAE